MDNREERIRQKAHEIWEQAGRPDDKSVDHWSQAERLVDKEDGKDETDELGNEPNPRHEAIDIAPGPDGDIHEIPAAIGSTKRRG